MPSIFKCHVIKGLLSAGYGLKKKITRGLALVSTFLRCSLNKLNLIHEWVPKHNSLKLKHWGLEAFHFGIRKQNMLVIPDPRYRKVQWWPVAIYRDIIYVIQRFILHIITSKWLKKVLIWIKFCFIFCSGWKKKNCERCRVEYRWLLTV